MKNHNFYVYGKNPVGELFRDKPELLQRLYLKDTLDPELFNYIKSEARKYKIPILRLHPQKIVDMVGDVAHQGIVAEIKEFPYTEFHPWLDGLDLDKNPLVFILNEITDPHNVGAIIRSAAAFGAAGILIPAHNQAGVTGVVYKTSAGAAHKIPIIRIGNTQHTISLLKEKKFWVAGLDADGEKTLDEETFETPTVIILGSEGSGIRLKIQESCDYMIRIPIESAVESLNASVSASIVGYAYYNQKIKKAR